MRNHMHICDEIRVARGSGNTRCGVVDGRMSLVEAARVFGLADNSAIYRPIRRTEADTIATHILQTSLAYGTRIMSLSWAADLWQRFMALFSGPNIEFATNAGAPADTGTAPLARYCFTIGICASGIEKVTLTGVI